MDFRRMERNKLTKRQQGCEDIECASRNRWTNHNQTNCVIRSPAMKMHWNIEQSKAAIGQITVTAFSNILTLNGRGF